MPNFNKNILAGNLTRDFELKVLPSGNHVANSTVAINRKWRTESGEEKEEVTFVDITAFGKQAETLNKYATKGKPMLFEGRLKQENWIDKTTQANRSKLIVIIETFQFLSAAPESSAKADTAPAAPADLPSQAELMPKAKPALRPMAAKADPVDTRHLENDGDVPF